VVWTPDGGQRDLPVAHLVTGVRKTSLAPGEVLRSVGFPPPPAWAAHRRVSLAPLGRSAALLVARHGSAGTSGDGAFTLTVTASTPSPRVFTFPTIPTREVLATDVDTTSDWYDDAHGAADWRRAMTLRLAEELRAEAAKRALS